jgi:TRAP-type C4-dicarboxylate transport system permease small subunit
VPEPVLVQTPPSDGASRLLPAILAMDRIAAAVACTAAAVMTLVVIAEVFARYLLSSSMAFSNELSRVLFVWTIFLGMPLALSRGRHVGISILDRLLPEPGARNAIRLSAVASLVALAVVFYKSIELAARNWDQTLNTIPVTAGVYYLPIPIGIGLTIIFLAFMTISGIRQFIEDEEETD